MRLVNFFAVTICFFISSSAFSWWMWTPGDGVDDSSQSLLVAGYRPDQPIAFDHSLHAGDRNIDCQYCHNGARRSTSAGIPPLNTCMGCHKVVNKDATEIKKITELYEKGMQIEWTKVNVLPDYVKFSHKIHVGAEDPMGRNLLACEDCHGNVKGMTIVEQWAPLQMGWCIECHNKVKIPAKDGKPAVTNASVSCNTCHY